MTERTTVRLPEALIVQAKSKARAEGLTLTSLIEDGLRRVLSDGRTGSSKRRTPPRVSKAKGGLRSGLDAADISDLQHLDDVDYVARMHRPE